MITVYAKCGCGCCIEEMQFQDEKSAQAAFDKAGLGSSMSIKDDAGVQHQGLDTFYKFSLDSGDVRDRSLNYLAEQIYKS